MRARRKALQGAKKSGPVTPQTPTRVALERLHEGINSIDFSRLEKEGGAGVTSSGSNEEEALSQPAKIEAGVG